MGLTCVAKVGDISPDEPLAVSAAGEQIALYLLDGSIYATHNVCTHQFALLTDGYLEDGCIECPLHQGKFDVRTGAALSAPASAPLKTYRVHVEGNDVMVDL
jgi:3-phenylpropionate/trans-cinnamate dioxygenase ferredoxin subunit